MQSVLTMGEALVALVPAGGTTLTTAAAMEPYVGGSELNVAVGLARLGKRARWLGALGDDPMGKRVRSVLEGERVATDLIATIPGARTAVYFRDVARGPGRDVTYYRSGSAASYLTEALWPATPRGSWLHLTGITAALGPQARALMMRAVEWAAENGVPISFDPNYRPALWTVEEAGPWLREFARRSDFCLLSDSDALVMVGSDNPAVALPRLHEIGVSTAVMKRAHEPIAASDHSSRHTIHVDDVEEAVDTVGAGDGFDAGFIAASLAGAHLKNAVKVGAYVGARAVERIGEHRYPTLATLPPEIAALLRPTVDTGPDTPVT